MKRMLVLLLCAALCGCASSSLGNRRQQKSAAYESLSPEWKDLVDRGKLAVGMPQDAVYIAWGKPDRVHSGGPITTWLYVTTTWDEYPFWNPYYYGYQNGFVSSPVLDKDYIPRESVAAQVVFNNGTIKSWSRLPPQPASRLLAQQQAARR